MLKAFSSLVDFLAPPRCARCGRAWEGALCGDCSAQLWEAWEPRERKFGPLVAQAPFLYPDVKDLIVAFKYQGVWSLAGELARFLKPLIEPGEAVVPVPLHPARRRLRGYCQTELLARELGAPVLKGLRRTKNTRAQVNLGPDERTVNVKGAFQWERPPPEGPVVILDDVITTGSTVSEAAAAVPAGRVRALAVAFARPWEDAVGEP